VQFPASFLLCFFAAPAKQIHNNNGTNSNNDDDDNINIINLLPNKFHEYFATPLEYVISLIR